MAKVLDCGLEVTEPELKLRFYIKFLTLEKGTELMIHPTPSYRINSTSAVILWG